MHKTVNFLNSLHFKSFDLENRDIRTKNTEKKFMKCFFYYKSHSKTHLTVHTHKHTPFVMVVGWVFYYIAVAKGCSENIVFFTIYCICTYVQSTAFSCLTTNHRHFVGKRVRGTTFWKKNTLFPKQPLSQITITAIMHWILQQARLTHLSYMIKGLIWIELLMF